MIFGLLVQRSPPLLFFEMREASFLVVHPSTSCAVAGGFCVPLAARRFGLASRKRCLHFLERVAFFANEYIG